MAYMDYERKHAEYAKQTGPVRRGVGMAIFWYNTSRLADRAGGFQLPHGDEPGRLGAASYR
jgi:hypothetical protein